MDALFAMWESAWQTNVFIGHEGIADVVFRLVKVAKRAEVHTRLIVEQVVRAGFIALRAV